MQLLNRLNFQSKINLITFMMVVLVVVAGAVAIDRVVIPGMERDVRDQAWHIAQGIAEQVQSISGRDREAQLKARLSPLFQVLPKLLYIELLDKDGKTVLWMGEEKYRAAREPELLSQNSMGTLFLRRVSPKEPVYEIVPRPGEKPHVATPVNLRVGVSAKSVQQLSRQLFRVLFIVTLLILVLSFFLTQWFTGMITRPVDRLLRMTHLLAKGQLEGVIKEVREAPPCWQTLQESSFAETNRTPVFCPLLGNEEGQKAGILRSIPDDPCSLCEVFRYSRRDELSRLVFAFQYMAAKIHTYQEKLRQRYEFEERLLDACPDGIIANDRQGQIILCNRGAERLLGYTQTEVLKQLSVQQVYRPGEAQAIKKALLSDEYGESGVLLDYTTEILRKDGSAIPIRLSAAILSEHEEEIGVVGYFHDLTELHQHMNALMESNERLNEANKALGRLNHRYLEMLSFVTHELKSPIANGYMSANALRQEIFGSLAPEQKNMVEAVCRNLEQSMEMIRHYLDLSRIEKDELPIQPQPTELLTEVIEPVLKGLAGMILERDANIELEVPPELEWTLDPELFRGVFTNLIGNALKYGDKSPKIRVSVVDKKDRCRMEVWNSGPGIRREDHEKLFRKFQRLHTARHPSVRGTGLGLFITKTVVERHGGKIWVESKEGESTNFIIELPKR